MAKGYLYDNGYELISREEIDGLPDTSEASQGDVLSLDSDKEPVWSAPSGGGGGGIESLMVVINTSASPNFATFVDMKTQHIYNYGELKEKEFFYMYSPSLPAIALVYAITDEFDGECLKSYFFDASGNYAYIDARNLTDADTQFSLSGTI